MLTDDIFRYLPDLILLGVVEGGRGIWARLILLGVVEAYEKLFRMDTFLIDTKNIIVRLRQKDRQQRSSIQILPET